MTDLERLGERIAREQDALRARSSDRADTRERLAALQLAEPRRVSRALYAGLACAALAAAAAVVMLWPRAPEAKALQLRVEGVAAPVAAGAWVEAPADRSALPLRFSDGTCIELQPRSRLRVIELNAHGAHVLLESGRAHVAVVHSQAAAWRMSVGPFAVRVIGTRFDVAWDPERDVFELDLERGEVALEGCALGHDYRLHTGQAIDASCKAGVFHVRDRLQPRAPEPAPAAPAVEPPKAEAEVPQAASVAEPRASAHAPPRTTSSSDWRALARHGEYAQAFERVRDAEVDADLSRLSAADLTLLAETARHVGEESKEAQALLSIRRRFAGTARAGLAAFALGRLEFDKNHAYAEAARWFGTYLKEQPRGPLVREARGRLIEATLASGDRARARQLAERYLEDHPSGPHAELAHSLLQ